MTNTGNAEGAKYIETRTQEDIAEGQARDGRGCKACDGPIIPGQACGCEGDIYCWTCGLALDLMPGTDVHVLSTRAQVAVSAQWDAAGISTR